MKLLFIGGTRFVGMHMVSAALARGHEVTLFHRGSTGPDLFPGVDTILGDRTKDLGLLQGKTWDAVVDSSGYEPATVAASAEALKPLAPVYLFVSTISVYEPSETPIREDDALPPIPDGMPLTGVTGESYGPLKVLCEQEVERVYGENALIMRPGLVVGPGDYTDRFTYWPLRMTQGNEILVPNRPDQPWQMIDGRDLGEFAIHLLESGARGVFNGVGPASKKTMVEYLEETRRAANPDCKLVLVEEAFLQEREVQEWVDLPFFLWSSSGPKSLNVDNSRALQNGLTLRPVGNTVRDLLAWKAGLADPSGLTTGMTKERQDELLAEWRVSSSKR